MAEKIDLSLDEIIKANKTRKSPGAPRGRGRGGRGGRGGGGGGGGQATGRSRSRSRGPVKVQQGQTRNRSRSRGGGRGRGNCDGGWSGGGTKALLANSGTLLLSSAKSGT